MTTMKSKSIEIRHYDQECYICVSSKAVITVKAVYEITHASIDGIEIPYYELKFEAWLKADPSQVHRFNNRQEVATWMHQAVGKR